MASTPSQFSRKKRKAVTSFPQTNNQDSIVTRSTRSNVLTPAFPLVAFLWPARRSVSQWVTLPLILIIIGLFRWALGLWGYSGFQSPPMHGDFEAQRHWMEITTKLPVSQWYFHDLEWWGLDYPPLTAYHSWLFGKLGTLIDPAWFELEKSRAFESPRLKIYMRATVVLSEYAIYIPALVIFLRHYARNQAVSGWQASIALVAILMQPATMLIDHGHFQYNTVMLGLVVSSMSSIFADRLLWACAFFVGALQFKQMSLYYAPAIFVFLLGSCIVPRLRFLRLFLISLITILVFALTYLPFIAGVSYDQVQGRSFSFPSPPLLSALLPNISSESWYYPLLLELSQSIHRIFPFARGLFEDKVANFWCAIHTFHKLHNYPIPLLQRASLFATLTAISPAAIIPLFSPRKEILPPAFATSAWGFFLFSFQVHEKSVLLPLLPMTLMLGSRNGLNASNRAWIGFANILATWTMYPLLKRDGLQIPYFTLTLLWAYLMGLPPTSLSAYLSVRGSKSPPAAAESSAPSTLTKLIHVPFYVVMIVWHVLEAFVATPDGKPDLWIVLNVLIGAAGFGLCYLWCTWQLITQSGLFVKRKPFTANVEGKPKTS